MYPQVVVRARTAGERDKCMRARTEQVNVLAHAKRRCPPATPDLQPQTRNNLNRVNLNP